MGLFQALRRRRPRYVVAGGSNSLRNRGWVQHLRDCAGKRAEVVNLSIGQSSSLMGLMRLKSAVTLGPDDIVLWEYAINDLNHLRNGGYDPALIFDAIRDTHAHCRARGARLVAVVMKTCDVEARGADEPDYYRQLRALFADLNVPLLDVSAAFRQDQGIAFIDDSYYDENTHYSAGGAVVRFTAAQALHLLRNLPDGAGDAVPPSQREFSLVTDFSGGRATEFENNALRYDGWCVEDPLSVLIPGGSTVHGLLVLSTASSAPVHLHCAGVTADLSLAHKAAQKPLLKHALFASSIGKTPGTGATPQPLTLTRSDVGEAACDLHFRARANRPETPAIVVGVIVSRPA